MPSIEIDNDATLGHLTPSTSTNTASLASEQVEVTPESTRTTNVLSHIASGSTISEIDPSVTETDHPLIPSPHTSPEPFQTDLQGHYIGPSSGLSFLLRIQKRLHRSISSSANSSIFTFGDAPLPDVDSSFFVLPPISESRALVVRYFDFVAPTHRFLHRSTVESWLSDLYENPGRSRYEEDYAHAAVLFMVLAQAQIHLPDSTASDTEKRLRRISYSQLKL